MASASSLSWKQPIEEINQKDESEQKNELAAQMMPMGLHKHMCTVVAVSLLMLSTPASSSRIVAQELDEQSVQEVGTAKNAASCFIERGAALARGQKTNVFDITPGLGGIFFRRSSDLEEFFTIQTETEHWFKLLDRALKARGTDLILIPLPTRGIVQKAHLDRADVDQALYDPEFAKGEFLDYVAQLKGAGLNVVDVLNGISAANSWEEFFYLHDHHWTTRGSQTVAKLAAEVAKLSPSYSTLSKYDFELKAIRSTSYKSQMALDIQQRCHIDVSPEPETAYEVSRSAATEGDLFGDAKETNPAALVGTSFSAQSFFYFQGFLEQETSLQVSNYAVDGGEFDGALAGLLMSRDFVGKRPPLIFWETPSYYDVNFIARTHFAQLVPAVFGPCSQEDLLRSAVMANDTERVARLNATPDEGIAGERYYVAVDTDPGDDGGVLLDLYYANGEHLTRSLGHFKSVSSDGRYYYLLNSEVEGNLTSLEIHPSATVQHMEIALCRAPLEFSAEK